MALALQIGMKSLRNEFDEAHQLELQIATVTFPYKNIAACPTIHGFPNLF